jgi:hypothetical protein
LKFKVGDIVHWKFTDYYNAVIFINKEKIIINYLNKKGEEFHDYDYDYVDLQHYFRSNDLIVNIFRKGSK